MIVRTLPPEDSKTILKLIMTPGGKFMKGKGCAECKQTGYKGRTGIFEVLVLNKALRELITAKSTLAELRRAAIANGMKTLLMDGVSKAWGGVTTLDEVRRVTAELF
ncbi:MAG: hypothetical protein HY077_18620 [Elusimicrobia bacterium]|nr:hypothetical protein [Elusimicrobiota bacterium]